MAFLFAFLILAPALSAQPAPHSPTVKALLEILGPETPAEPHSDFRVESIAQAIPPGKRAAAREVLSRLEPRATIRDLREIAVARTFLGDAEGALRASDSLKRLEPGFESDYIHALTQARLGRYEDAYSEAAALKQRFPNRPELDSLMAATRGRMSGAAETSSPLESPNDDAVSATGGFNVRPGEASDTALALARQAAVARDAGDMDASWSLVQAAINADPKSEAIQRLYRFAEADHRRYTDTKVYMGRSKDALQAGRGEEAVAWMQKAAERSGSATVRAILEQTRIEAARLASRPQAELAREPTRHQRSRPLGAVGLALIAVGVGAFLVLEARREQDRIREMVEVIGPGGLVVAGGALFALSMIPPTRAAMTLRSSPAAVQQAEAAQVLAPAAAMGGKLLLDSISYSKAPSNGPNDAGQVKPKKGDFLEKLRRVKNKGSRTRWVDEKGRIHEWDSQHGELEVYDWRGRHVGVRDPNTGEWTKPAVPGREIEP